MSDVDLRDKCTNGDFNIFEEVTENKGKKEQSFDFRGWILFHFCRRSAGSTLSNLTTRFQQFYKKKSQVQPSQNFVGVRKKTRRRTKKGEKTHFRSNLCHVGRCHRGRRCSTARTGGRNKKKGRKSQKERLERESFSFFFYELLQQKHRVLWQQRSYSLLSLGFQNAQVFVDQAEGLRASSRELQAIYVIIVTRLDL